MSTDVEIEGQMHVAEFSRCRPIRCYRVLQVQSCVYYMTVACVYCPEVSGERYWEGCAGFYLLAYIQWPRETRLRDLSDNDKTPQSKDSAVFINRIDRPCILHLLAYSNMLDIQCPKQKNMVDLYTEAPRPAPDRAASGELRLHQQQQSSSSSAIVPVVTTTVCLSRLLLFEYFF